MVDDGAETLYNPDLDKWLLNNQMTLERFKLHRGIARVYSILLYKDPEIEQELTAPKFRL